MQQSLTLYQYTSLIGKALTLHPELFNAWITAELSDVRIAGGHCYMELLEKNSAGQTVARLRANIWRNVYQVLNNKFRSVTGNAISNGMKILVRGSVCHHPLYGMSFNIIDIDPSYTLGDMERIRQEILMKLKAHGVLEANRQLPFPLAPQKIAVISAEGAAGYGDFINQLNGNSDRFVFYPVLVPAVMQGDRTVPSVLYALEWIESTIDVWDCVVIIRGGGSSTDLNGFDNFELAYRVATFPLPIVVGIGHERDRTVLDEIACVRCKTPTAVAGFLIDSLRVAMTKAIDLTGRITRHVIDTLNGEQRRLAQLAVTVPATVSQKLDTSRLRLKYLNESIPILVKGRTEQESIRLRSIEDTICSASSMVLQRANQRVESLVQLIEALSPDNTLKRGYSVTRIGSRAVKDVSMLKAGDIIETELATGKVISTVK